MANHHSKYCSFSNCNLLLYSFCGLSIRNVKSSLPKPILRSILSEESAIEFLKSWDVFGKVGSYLAAIDFNCKIPIHT